MLAGEPAAGRNPAAAAAPPDPPGSRRQDHSSSMTQADQPAKPDARQPAGTNRETLTRHLPRSATGYMSNPATDRRFRAGGDCGEC